MPLTAATVKSMYDARHDGTVQFYCVFWGDPVKVYLPLCCDSFLCLQYFIQALDDNSGFFLLHGRKAGWTDHHMCLGTARWRVIFISAIRVQVRHPRTLL